MDYAHSKAGQNTSRNGSKSVALVRTYLKLRSLVNTRPFAGYCTAVNNLRHFFLCNNMSQGTAIPINGMYTKEIFRSACASVQSNQSFLSTVWIVRIAKDPKFLHVDSKDDQTLWLCTLI